jgi:RNA recognition motif-containing protein
MADTNLYVGNLPWTTTKEDLGDHFSQYGKIRETRIITDKESGKSRGFGFVEFTTDAEAQAALAEDGQEYGGRTLRVNLANRQREERPRSNGNGHGHKGGKPRGQGGRPRTAYGDES